MHQVREMNEGDYEKCYMLWSQTAGMSISDADSKPAIADYLKRNPGFSLVCELEEQIIGTLLCGHDGRRGYIYHAAVNPTYRGRGIGSEMINRSLQKLHSEGIMKCHILVIHDNELGKQFWHNSGWTHQEGILLYSRYTS